MSGRLGPWCPRNILPIDFFFRLFSLPDWCLVAKIVSPMSRELFLTRNYLRADFREGDEDSNFSIFRVRRCSEWPNLFTELPFLWKSLIPWIASPLFTENPFFHWKVLHRIPLPKIGSDYPRPKCPLKCCSKLGEFCEKLDEHALTHK